MRIKFSERLLASIDIRHPGKDMVSFIFNNYFNMIKKMIPSLGERPTGILVEIYDIPSRNITTVPSLDNYKLKIKYEYDKFSDSLFLDMSESDNWFEVILK